MRKVIFNGKTDVGKKRSNNEDAIVIQNIWDENHILAVAIDGVGGYEGGEVASKIASEKIVEYLENYRNGERIDLIKQAVVYANNEIFNQREIQPGLSQMSCVLTAIIVEVDKRRINMAHVGDTRLYKLAGGYYSKLSHDHSLVGYREEIGDLTEEEAMHHPQRNVINQDVGSRKLSYDDRNYIEVATFPIETQSIQLLLCSDGLCDLVTSYQMQSVLEEDIPIESKVDTLIEAANLAGGKDNISVIIIELEYDDAIEEEYLPADNTTHENITDEIKTAEENTAANSETEKAEYQPDAPTAVYQEQHEPETPQHIDNEPKQPHNHKRIITLLLTIIVILIAVCGYCVYRLTQAPTQPLQQPATQEQRDSVEARMQLLLEQRSIDAQITTFEEIINDKTQVAYISNQLNDSTLTNVSLTTTLQQSIEKCNQLRDSLSTILIPVTISESEDMNKSSQEE